MSKLSKPERLVEILIAEFRQGLWHPGQRFYSEMRLATRHEMSRQTVRVALAQLIEQGYLYSVKGSGTYVTEQACQKMPKEDRSVAILVTYLSDYIFPSIIRELERELRQAGYSVFLASTSNSVSNERALLKELLNRDIHGIILEPTKSALPNPNLDLYEEIARRQIPLISINSSYSALDFPVIRLDDERAAFIAGSYLLDAGHRQIAAVLKADDLQGLRRFSGLQRALLNAKLPLLDNHIFWYTSEDIANMHTLAPEILHRLEGCTAVLCYNDQLAVNLFSIFQEAGIRVPQDLSVISVDNSRYAALTNPGLSSVENPISSLGILAARSLLRAMEGQDLPHEQLLPATLVTRQSVRPLPVEAVRTENLPELSLLRTTPEEQDPQPVQPVKPLTEEEVSRLPQKSKAPSSAEKRLPGRRPGNRQVGSVFGSASPNSASAKTGRQSKESLRPDTPLSGARESEAVGRQSAPASSDRWSFDPKRDVRSAGHDRPFAPDHWVKSLRESDGHSLQSAMLTLEKQAQEQEAANLRKPDSE